MTAVEIRTAVASDAQAIAGLLDELGYPTLAEDSPQRIERLAASRGTALLAIHDAQVVGLATVHVLSVINRPHDVAWLTALVVHGTQRRVGVGRALVRAVEAFARAAGCERLSVTTHEARTDAQRFYTDVGLEPTGRRFGKALSR
jgi:GNAT superfamily N-acetyltransferase